MTTLSREEMRSRALAFATAWAGPQREETEAKSFLDQFFVIFGRERRAVDDRFEHRVERAARGEGRIGEKHYYRLPTDREWSLAVGIGREEDWKSDTTPATVFKVPDAFPWGDEWPPPPGAWPGACNGGRAVMLARREW